MIVLQFKCPKCCCLWNGLPSQLLLPDAAPPPTNIFYQRSGDCIIPREVNGSWADLLTAPWGTPPTRRAGAAAGMGKLPKSAPCLPQAPYLFTEPAFLQSRDCGPILPKKFPPPPPKQGVVLWILEKVKLICYDMSRLHKGSKGNSKGYGKRTFIFAMSQASYSEGKNGDGRKAHCPALEGEKQSYSRHIPFAGRGGIILLFRFRCYFWMKASAGACGLQGCGGELQTGSKRCTEKSHFNCISMK